MDETNQDANEAVGEAQRLCWGKTPKLTVTPGQAILQLERVEDTLQN